MSFFIKVGVPAIILGTVYSYVQYHEQYEYLADFQNYEVSQRANIIFSSLNLKSNEEDFSCDSYLFGAVKLAKTNLKNGGKGVYGKGLISSAIDTDKDKKVYNNLWNKCQRAQRELDL